MTTTQIIVYGCIAALALLAAFLIGRELVNEGRREIDARLRFAQWMSSTYGPQWTAMRDEVQDRLFVGVDLSPLDEFMRRPETVHLIAQMKRGE